MSRLTKRFLAFFWQSSPALAFTQGQAQTVSLRTAGLFDPQKRVKTVSLASGTLPTGCSLVGYSMVYDGVGSAASTSFTLTASDGTTTNTSSGGSATIQAAQTNQPPVWTVPEGYQLPGFTTAGGTVDLTQYANDPEGDPMVFSRVGGTAPGGVTVSESGVLTVPAGLTPSTYTVQVGLGTSGESDWLARSQAAGVIWAHDFRAADDPSLYWAWGEYNYDAASGGLGSGTLGARRCGFVSNATKGIDPANGIERFDTGILGNGCLEQYTRAGVTVGGLRWGRPIAPVTGVVYVNNTLGQRMYTPSSAASESANLAGLPTLDFKKFYVPNAATGDPYNKMSNGGGGMFANPADYVDRDVPANFATTAAKEMVTGGTYTGEIWIQHWIKFKTLSNGQNLLDYTPAYSPSDTQGWVGKLWLLDANMGPRDQQRELGLMLNMRDAGPRPQMYGKQGGFWYGAIQASPGPTFQFQNAYSAACTVGDKAACWSWPKDEWVSVMMRVKLGRDNPTGDWSSPSILYRDHELDLWVADKARIQGGLGYLQIIQSRNFAVSYPSGYPNTSGAFTLENTDSSPGFNWFHLLQQHNPSTSDAAPYNGGHSWVLYDQVICSTQQIACPAYHPGT